MKKKIKFLVLGSFLAWTFVNGQDKKAKKADADFESYAYADAIESYESLIKKGYSSEDIYKNLGNANYQNADYVAAAEWYDKLFQLESEATETEYYFKYAQTLKSLGEYEKSDMWMQKFDEAKVEDGRASKFADNKDYLDQIKENSGRYAVENLPLNSRVSDFAPSFYKKDLIFSSARDTGRLSRSIHEWNNQPFTNLYRARRLESGGFGTAEKLSKALNKKTHESSTAFTKDGTTVYFTRNNSENGRFERDEKGLSRLKIYRATLKNEEWTNITELPFNDDGYSVAHPTLSADEKKLYFASDMPGTVGRSDIFVVDINADGSFGSPENLGNAINTEGRETFPFVTPSGVLYFASDGHPGLGGLDIYAIHLARLTKTNAQNVGRPVNSEEDDFSFIIDEQTSKGFFASNRDGGLGNDDIYGFTENEPLVSDCATKVDGIVKDQKTGEPLPNAKVVIFDENKIIVSEGGTNANGVFSLSGKCDSGNYKIVASEEDHIEGTVTFSVSDSEDSDGLAVLLLSKLQEMKTGDDLTNALNLGPIYFDVNKSEIQEDAKVVLKKVVTYMRQFPNSKIQVSSHTDSRGYAKANLTLSNARAKATAAYIILQGIAKDRVRYKGFGEIKLLNTCKNYVKCSEEEHRANRRSEFILIE